MVLAATYNVIGWFLRAVWFFSTKKAMTYETKLETLNELKKSLKPLPKPDHQTYTTIFAQHLRADDEVAKTENIWAGWQTFVEKVSAKLQNWKEKGGKCTGYIAGKLDVLVTVILLNAMSVVNVGYPELVQTLTHVVQLINTAI